MKRFLSVAVAAIGLFGMGTSAEAAPPWHADSHRAESRRDHERFHDDLEHRAYHRQLEHREAHRYPLSPRQHAQLHSDLRHEAYHDRLEHRAYHRGYSYRPVAPSATYFYGGYARPSSRFSLYIGF